MNILNPRKMYRITRTLFHCKNGENEVSTEVVEVDDLEEYRERIRQPRHRDVNFIYQVIPDEK